MTLQLDHYINGQWTPSKDGRRIERHSPATGESVGDFALAGQTDAEAAIGAARAAFDSGVWSQIDSAQRAAILLKIADMMDANAEEWGKWESATNGMPLQSGIGTVGYCSNIFRYYAGLARTIHGDAYTFNQKQMGMTIKEPIGVVSIIIPWNFPLGEATWKAAPALAAGCTIVAKPDVKTPATVLLLAELMTQAGLPDGVFNVVVGNPEDIGGTLTAHPDIDHISFTGSTQSGRIVMESAAQTVKPLHLELGGKSPLIIFDDADLDAAANNAAFNIFWHNGQVCTASSRILVQDTIMDAFVERLKEKTDALKISVPSDPDATISAVVSHDHMDRILNYIKMGQAEGATLAYGGQRLTDAPFDQGAYVQPTIFTDVSNDMKIAQEEIFGPVAALISFSTTKEALAIANDTSFGLGAGVWTQNLDRALQLARGLKAGSVWINNYGADRLELPWGGYKQSGYGRELGQEGLDEYLVTKSVHIHLGEF